MIRRMLVAFTVAAAATVPLQPARAELYTIEQLRGLCRGESAESPEFRTGAGYRLLAQIARERCRMFLLGVADAALRNADLDLHLEGLRAQLLPFVDPHPRVDAVRGTAALARGPAFPAG